MSIKNAAQVNDVLAPPSDPGDYFKDSSVAGSYDAYIRANVPFYHSSIAANAAIIQAHGRQLRRDLNLIEFGPGTGNLTLEILRSADVAKYWLVDHSRPMLDLLLQKAQQERLRPERLVACHSAMLDREWVDSVQPATLDAALFHLALDHVAEDDDLDALLAELSAKLAPSGLLVVAEKCADGSRRQSTSWKSFAKMVDFRFSHMVANGLKTRAEAEAWRHHLLAEDVLRPMASLWSAVEAAGLEVVSAQGAPLPHPTLMSYEGFYNQQKVEPVSREIALDQDRAFGIAILACRKVH